MKLLLLLAVMLPGLIQSQDIAKELKTLNVKPDQFKGTLFYTPYPNGPGYVSTMYFYMSGNENAIYGARFVLQYVGNNWIFFDKVAVMIDGNTEYFAAKPDRDVLNSGFVQEKLDFDIADNPHMLRLLRDVCKAKTVSIRFEGKHYHEIILSPFQISIINKYFSIYLKHHGQAVIDKAFTPQKIDPSIEKREDAKLLTISIIVFVIGGMFVYAIYRANKSKNDIQKHLMKMKSIHKEE